MAQKKDKKPRRWGITELQSFLTITVRAWDGNTMRYMSQNHIFSCSSKGPFVINLIAHQLWNTNESLQAPSQLPTTGVPIII